MTTKNRILVCLTLGLFFGPISSVLATPVFIFRAAPYMGIGLSDQNEDVAQLHGAEFSVAPSWALSEALMGGIEFGAEGALLVTQNDHTTNREMLTWTTQQIYGGAFATRSLNGPWSIQAGWRYGSGSLRQRGHENTPSSHTSISARGAATKHVFHAGLNYELSHTSGWYLSCAQQHWRLRPDRDSQKVSSEIATGNGLRLASEPLEANDPWLRTRSISGQTIALGMWWAL